MYEIRKYPVQHPKLQNYIRFFWEIHIENTQLNHKLIPQRNISLRFNLNEIPHFITINGQQHLLDDVYFSGLHDHFINAHLKTNGKIDTLGICFFPDGFFPFINIPVAECKNQVLGAAEVGLKPYKIIGQKIKEAPAINARLEILEKELVLLLAKNCVNAENFRRIFNVLKQTENQVQITDFCYRNNIAIRTLERMYNKYLGVPATTFGKLNRFHNSMNQLLSNDFSKLSDLAFDNGYFDQMHFIRDFKRFTGDTPKNFIRQNNSILQIGKLR
jgi:AraC-like DNA-binding protein